MNLQTFMDTDITDPGQRHAMLLAEETDHRLLAGAALDLGLGVSVYPLADASDWEEWLHLNYRMHRELAEGLGLDVSPELEDWDLSDPEQARQWLYTEISDHIRLAQAYGVA